MYIVSVHIIENYDRRRDLYYYYVSTTQHYECDAEWEGDAEEAETETMNALINVHT